MKIIDFEVKGNAVRFYLGEDDCFDYWGDDWDDTPYEHNAGTVYERYCAAFADFYVDLNLDVLTPEGDWHYRGNSPFCKEDFKNRKAPCVVIPYEYKYSWNNCYSICALSDNALKFYFEDEMKPGKYYINADGEIVNLKI